jgi:hypothetical protein
VCIIGNGPEAGGELDSLSAADELSERSEKGDVRVGGVGMEDEDHVGEEQGALVAVHWHERAQV